MGTLTAHLKNYSGILASVWFNQGDNEGALFASDIAQAIEDAKWRVFAPASKMDLAESGVKGSHVAIETGVVVASTEDHVSVEAANVIVRQLNALGFDCKRDDQPNKRPVPMVFVNVESRPDGPQGEAKLRQASKIERP